MDTLEKIKHRDFINKYNNFLLHNRYERTTRANGDNRKAERINKGDSKTKKL